MLNYYLLISKNFICISILSQLMFYGYSLERRIFYLLRICKISLKSNRIYNEIYKATRCYTHQLFSLIALNSIEMLITIERYG